MAKMDIVYYNNPHIFICRKSAIQQKNKELARLDSFYEPNYNLFFLLDHF